MLLNTLGYQINVGLRLLNFELFSQPYALIRYPTFINFQRMSVQGYGHLAYIAKDVGEKVNCPKTLLKGSRVFYDFD